MLTAAVAAGVGAVGALTHGAFHRNSAIFGRVLRRLPGSARAVALTFDDGPNPEATPRILDVLRQHDVRATFFLLGRHVDRWPELARRVVAEGHAVGNHGYHHRRLHARGPAYTRTDLSLGTQAIESATGRRPRHFRAPHGFRNPWVNRIAHELGQHPVGWTLGVWDTDRPGAATIVERVRRGVRPGCILLLHDGDAYAEHGDRMQTAEALGPMIEALRADGYRLSALPS